MKTLKEELSGITGVFLFLGTKEAKEKLYVAPKTEELLKFHSKEDSLFVFLTQKTEMIRYYNLLQVCEFSFYKENMNNKLEIEIPEGKEIDWKESAKQEKIVFKDEILNYASVTKKLFKDAHYYTDKNGDIEEITGIRGHLCPNNAATEEQLQCILAKNKLANVAKYLNGDWKLNKMESYYGLDSFEDSFKITLYTYLKSDCFNAQFAFKSKKLAEQAIKILGEEEIKLALKPLC